MTQSHNLTPTSYCAKAMVHIVSAGIVFCCCIVFALTTFIFVVVFNFKIIIIFLTFFF